MSIFDQDRETLTALVRTKLRRRALRIEPMAAGMGTRRFHRVFLEGDHPAVCVARIEDDGTTPTPSVDRSKSVPEAPPWLTEPPLEPLRTYLEDAGLPVPESFLHDPERGIDLLEDVGNRTLGDAPEAEKESLYREACQLVVRLQRLDTKAPRLPAFDRTLDQRLLETKCWKWLNWTIPLILERPASPAETDQTKRLFDRIAQEVEKAPLRLSHRDFKAENLHLWPRGDARLVMIDVQGAFLAPPEYDLVCLLYDLQSDLEESFITEVFEATRKELPDQPGEAESRRRFDALAIARLCKDISHVIHASRVRGDRRRWHELPRGFELLERAALRLEEQFPEIESLHCVIQALTPRALSSDKESRG